jgi:single-stranded-DNA-specific exonuclease
MLSPQWQIVSASPIPDWFLSAVQEYTSHTDGRHAAQILWQRSIQDLEKLPGFLDPNCYQPTSPFDFGQEMKLAVQRLLHARQAGEKVTIWGDFDADGITSTSVLWDGLGQFFLRHKQLDYYIPNRLSESHGLNNPGVEKLAVAGTKLIVTCDTGSTNLQEIEYANKLGIDVIITDHHTLPEERPDVIAIINPRYFSETHPLYHLSGVAVAYKLVEALYLSLPDVPQQSLESLLDLVAIGLIADLVRLSGDCRYLAQKGIEQLQKQTNSITATRPGVARLLELCKRNGDRPTDISFGIGPRINAVSRIHGDASFCVELLTNRDRNLCERLAQETELANTRRKSLQKKVLEDVKKKLERIDLSTTSVIVLEDPQWQGGVLGLVAGQIAQEYGRPTILLSSGDDGEDAEKQGRGGDVENLPINNYQLPTIDSLARGSARSVNNIDLYELVKSQEHLLHRFGGHPFAAGLSLPVENISLLRDGLNQQLKQKTNVSFLTPIITVDLIITVAELEKNFGKDLFRELKLLEPCGMGNPAPKLLIQNCWFTSAWTEHKAQDLRGKKIQYTKTTFNIWDRTSSNGFPGIWWEHKKEELPQEQNCEAIVELDFNAFKKRYEIRLLAIKKNSQSEQIDNKVGAIDTVDDYRNDDLNPKLKILHSDRASETSLKETALPLEAIRTLVFCPTSWDELQKGYQQAIAARQKLVLNYSLPEQVPPEQIWQTLVGIAKYLSRTGKNVTKIQLKEKLFLSDRTLELGLKALVRLGFICHYQNKAWYFSKSAQISSEADNARTDFLEALQEEQFQRQYFARVPLSTLSEQIMQSF